MILVVDNYDSFTWNIVHYLQMLEATVEVVRNDEVQVDEALVRGTAGIVLSPGPGRPDAAGISLALVAACAAESRPLLGICLGLQAVAQHFGAGVERAPRPMHGKTCAIEHVGVGLFAGLPSPFTATRYHSLAVRPGSVPDSLEVTAWAGDGTIQGLSHRSLPIHAVQFHPESIASDHGHALLGNFLGVAARRQSVAGPASLVA